MKKIILAVLAVVAMASCEQDNGIAPDGGGSQAVSFSASGIATRVSSDGTSWEAGDMVGIFMQDNSVYTYSNVCYLADNDATTTTFSVKTQGAELLYPNGRAAIFNAYYPYVDGATADGITIDVTDQSDLGAIDFMTSDTQTVTWFETEDDISTETEVAFEFEHKLSKVIVTIDLNDNVSSLEGIVVSLASVPTEGVYELDGVQVSTSNAASVVFNTIEDSAKTTATATAILHSGSIDTDMVFTIDGRTFSVPLKATLAVATIHNYTATVGADYVTFTGDYTISPWGDDEDGDAPSLDMTEVE